MFVPETFFKSLLLTSSLFHKFTPNDLVVQLSHGGTVEGNVLTNSEGSPFYAFRGIPYAEPPVGELRFKAPISKSGWSGSPFDATKDGPACIHHNMEDVKVGIEDCLTVNVYTPELPKTENAPKLRSVMVFIHGGSFLTGDGTSATHFPGNFMDFDIVLVTLNYRLEILGFLSTKNEDSPGNYGMLDQQLALLWVKNNIEAFGGDAESVTIFGHSAGGASVSYHLISPLSKGLYHRAIAMSGSSLQPWAYEPNPLFWAQNVAKEIGCPEEPTKELVNCLRTKPAVDLTLSFMHYEGLSSVPVPFTPTVDGYFLPDHPRMLMNSPENVNNVTVMAGITGAEEAMMVLWPYSNLPPGTVRSEEFLKMVFNSSISSHDEEISNMIRDRYLTQVDPKDDFAFAKVLTRALSHGMFDMNHYEEVKLLSKAGLPVFVYSYNYFAESWQEYIYTGYKHMEGPGHTEDLYLMFDLDWLGKLQWTKKDKKMAKILLRIWTNFAKTGNPDPTNEFHPHWNVSSPEVIQIHNLDLEITSKAYAVNEDELFHFWIRDVHLARIAKQTSDKENLVGL